MMYGEEESAAKHFFALNIEMEENTFELEKCVKHAFPALIRRTISYPSGARACVCRGCLREWL